MYKRQVIEYDVSDQLAQALDLYRELAGPSGAKLRPVPTPGGDETNFEISEAGKPTGQLAKCAAVIIMKVYYSARVARMDLVRQIGFLSQFITKWSPACDKGLHRVMCYIFGTMNMRMCSWLGDPYEDLELLLFSDALCWVPCIISINIWSLP